MRVYIHVYTQIEFNSLLPAVSAIVLVFCLCGHEPGYEYGYDCDVILCPYHGAFAFCVAAMILTTMVLMF